MGAKSLKLLMHQNYVCGYLLLFLPLNLAFLQGLEATLFISKSFHRSCKYMGLK